MCTFSCVKKSGNKTGRGWRGQKRREGVGRKGQIGGGFEEILYKRSGWPKGMGVGKIISSGDLAKKGLTKF